MLTSSKPSEIARFNRRHVVARIAIDTMAALIRHGLFKTGNQISSKNLVRFYASKQRKPNPDKRKPPKIDSTAQSLAMKGFLRAQKPYSPPENVESKFESLCQNILDTQSIELNDMSKKYALLSACQREFNHIVPNSLLHTMETTKDVLEFYQKPVSTAIPLDMMKNIDLPENLHIQYEYLRFHPDTDTMFNGVTAHPRSSTLVTGLKYKEKYPGFEARTTWPYNT